MKAPAGDPGDFCIAQRAETTLFIPEGAKSTSTPKRFQHVSPFAFFKVGFIRWIVRVSFAFYLDVWFDGSADGVVQPDFIGPAFVIAGFAEEGPVPIPRRSKYFGLIQRGLLFGCLRRAHRHGLEKIMRSTRLNVRLLTTCR